MVGFCCIQFQIVSLVITAVGVARGQLADGVASLGA
jgi:hypothetical protein